MVERRLGRGLDFFLSSGNQPAAAPGGAGGDPMLQIELSALEPNPFQPRQHFEPSELETLAQSIRASGVLQPILVREHAKGRYQIIAGERRWRAAKLAELERVPAIVRKVSDEAAAVFGLVENLQRADLNPIEKAQAFKQIQELTKGSQADVARQVGMDRSSVANFVRLLELPPEVREHVSRGTLSMGHARALLALPTADEQQTLADAVVKQKMSVRQVEALVQEMADVGEPQQEGGANKQTKRRKGERPIWLNEIEDNLCESLRTGVKVRYGAKRSKITIECRGRDEFERIYEQLKNLSGE